jgi:class 3 adenylate cyclase
MHDTASWLTNLGLDRYIKAFAANEIDFDVLRQLSDDDLRELGLPIGPRRKILAAIAALNDSDLPAGPRLGLKSARPRRDAERRQVTVVFIDLVGSTELTQRSIRKTCARS